MCPSSNHHGDHHYHRLSPSHIMFLAKCRAMYEVSEAEKGRREKERGPLGVSNKEGGQRSNFLEAKEGYAHWGRSVEEGSLPKAGYFPVSRTSK